MKEELFNNETKRKAGQQGREESQHPVYQRQPRQLGLYDVENEQSTEPRTGARLLTINRHVLS